MRDKDYRTVSKMIEYCDAVSTFLDGTNDLEAYRGDARTRYACDMCVMQIGELVGRLSDELKERWATIPWAQIRAMRNVYAHDYGNVKIEYVWQTVTRDVPALRGVLLEILAENELDVG